MTFLLLEPDDGMIRAALEAGAAMDAARLADHDRALREIYRKLRAGHDADAAACAGVRDVIRCRRLCRADAELPFGAILAK